MLEEEKRNVREAKDKKVWEKQHENKQPSGWQPQAGDAEGMKRWPWGEVQEKQKYRKKRVRMRIRSKSGEMQDRELVAGRAGPELPAADARARRRSRPSQSLWSPCWFQSSSRACPCCYWSWTWVCGPTVIIPLHPGNDQDVPAPGLSKGCVSPVQLLTKPLAQGFPKTQPGDKWPPGLAISVRLQPLLRGVSCYPLKVAGRHCAHSLAGACPGTSPGPSQLLGGLTVLTVEAGVPTLCQMPA